jgi:hypothetical protein
MQTEAQISGKDRYWLFSPHADGQDQLVVRSPDGRGSVNAMVRLAEPVHKLMQSSS